MAANGFKVNKSINLNPQAATPSNPVDGDIYYDSTFQSFAYYHNGSWANFDSVGTVASQEWLTGSQFTPALVRNSIIKVTGGTDVDHIAGISASFSGKQITIYNAGADLLVVEPEDANEPTANNRIMTPTGGSMNLVAGEVAVFVYDIVATRWLLVSISSNAGAQVIATTSNPGLVTLHQASLLPLDGVVLSDGDLNTATGVVGLDADRAAFIDAPLDAVTALTVAAAAGAEALVLRGDAGGDIQRWTNTGDTVTYLAIDESGHFNAPFTSGGSNYFTFKDDGTTIATLGSSFAGAIGGLYLFPYAGGPNSVGFEIEVGSSTARIVTSVLDNFDIKMAGAAQWRFSNDGSLSGISGGASGNFIHTVKDPVLAQDAATKAYVDRNGGAVNLLINGNFDFWQRGAAVKNLAGCNKTATHAAAANAYNMRYGADRWYIDVSDLSDAASGNTCNLTRQASGLNTSPYCGRVTATAGASTDVLFSLTQEIDRDLIPQIRGKKLILQFKLRADATYIANGGNTQIRITSGTDAGGNVLRRAYAGSAAVLSVQSISNATLTGSFQTFTYVSDNTVPTNSTELAVNISGGGSGAVTHYFEIAEVMVFAGLTTVPDYFVRHGSSYEAELIACQRYYEKSYEVDTVPGTVAGAFGQDGSFTTAWDSAVDTTALAPLPINNPRFLVKKWRPIAGTSPVTLYAREVADTLDRWFITGGFTQDVSAVDLASRCGFVVYANASESAVGTADEPRVIDGHWACSADIGDTV